MQAPAAWTGSGGAAYLYLSTCLFASYVHTNGQRSREDQNCAVRTINNDFEGILFHFYFIIVCRSLRETDVRSHDHDDDGLFC